MTTALQELLKLKDLLSKEKKVQVDTSIFYNLLVRGICELIPSGMLVSEATQEVPKESSLEMDSSAALKAVQAPLASLKKKRGRKSKKGINI